MNSLSSATLHRLTELHDSIRQVLDALPSEALDWSPAPDVNSVAVLVTHISGSERYWIGEKVGGQAANRNRDAEFTVREICANDLKTLLDAGIEMATAVLQELEYEDLARPAGVSREGFTYDTAWALQHALEHVAVHTGHVELMRQWWENRA